MKARPKKCAVPCCSKWRFSQYYCVSHFRAVRNSIERLIIRGYGWAHR